ncbi:T9SS type A sorting domain-containing protein [candidate division KSB1 bacterium]|nr:T9SS type A sorting domain-containing protein [candidate division KSB1 bacterium]
MSFRRIFILLLASASFSFSPARERELVNDDDDFRSNSTYADCYSASPNTLPERVMQYILWDRIMVSARLLTSRCVILEDLPFSGYYKINVIAEYSDSNVDNPHEEYKLLVDSLIIGDNIKDQTIDSTRTGTLYMRRPGVLYIRNDHGYAYLDKEKSVIKFVAGDSLVDGRYLNSINFYAIEVVPPPHVKEEPKFTAGNSNTVEWIPMTDQVIAQDVFCFDGTALAKQAVQRSLLQRTSSWPDDITNATTFEGLLEGRKYGYYVEGYLRDGRTESSDTTYSTQDASPPSRVDSLSISSYWNKYVKLVWHGADDDLSGVKLYQIVRSGSNGGKTEVVIVDTVFANNPCSQDSFVRFCYTDTLEDPDAANKTYIYRIDAVDNVGNKSSGRASEIVIKVTPPNLRTEPVSVLHYQGPHVTVTTDISQLPLPESHSLRFQAARDTTRFFDGQFGEDKYFFDSGWKDIQDTSDVIRYTYKLDTLIRDLNFVNGHKYYFRLQLKDMLSNFSEWSDTLMIIPDCFAPSDVSFLTATPITSNDSTKGWIDIKWGGAVDNVSGIDKYLLYRQVAGTLDSVEVHETAYLDSFQKIAYNDTVTYYVLSQDSVGNKRKSTNFRVTSWCQAPPAIEYIQHEGIDDNGEKYTTSSITKIIIGLKNFSFMEDIAEVVVRVVKLDTTGVPPVKITVAKKDIENHIELIVPLAETGKYCIQASATFQNKAKSLWAEPDYITRIPNSMAHHKLNGGKDEELFIGNFPNPFNPTTQISFNLPQDAHVLVQVYNVQGRLIKTLTDGFENAGNHSVLWTGVNSDGHAVASGLYYYRVRIKPDNGPEISKIQSMLLLK